MSIRAKLTIIILVLVSVPLIFVSAITFTKYQKSLETIRLSQVQDLARFKAERTEAYFSAIKTDIEISQAFYNVRKHLPVLSRSPAGAQSREATLARVALDGQLVRMQNVLELSDIMLTNGNGTIVYTSSPEHHGKDFLWSLAEISPEAFREGKKGIYFSEIFINRVVGNKAEILVVAPVSDLNNVPAGTIVFEINMALLYRQIQDTTGLGKTGEVLVGKKLGDEIVYLNSLRHDSATAPNRRLQIGSAYGLPIQKAAFGESGVGQSIDYRGKKVVAAWRPIPTPGWGLVAKIDIEEAFADVANLKKLVFIILAVVLILVAIITFSVSRSITLPLKKLSEGAVIIGRGNLDHRVGTNLKDEIGQLSRSFDKMTRDLKETTASRDDLNKEVAERKRAEEALQEAAADLQRSNKDLEQFAYVASHDLQEPLRAVAGFIGVLKKNYKDKLDAEAIEFIDWSVEGAERMQTLINDLLAFSRVGTKGGAFAPMNMKDAFDRAVKNLHAAIADSDALVTFDGDTMPDVVADATQMTQVLQNLVANAIKFRGADRPRVVVGAHRQDASWVISVADNGIGIEPQYYDRIFLIFQRLHTRSQYPGTGIGLAVCKKIVERHGGKIWIESKHGEGSTFYFSIPDRKFTRIDK
jgi:signal transduction histidine kinase